MISIGLPAIKPHFLKEAIQSVLDQRNADLELIVYNDRSDEKIRNVTGEFDDPRIRYYEGRAALEVVENWNRVLSYARGEYFVLFSDDDRYHPDFLEEMQGLFARYPACNIFHCRVRKINVRGELLEYTAICPEHEPGLEFLFHRVNGDREQFAPEFAVKTRKLRDIGGFVDLPLAWGSDDLTWFKLALEGGIAYNDRPLVDWRRSRQQISETGDVGLRLTAVDQYSNLLRTFVETIHPAGEKERLVLQQLRSGFDRYSDRQKAHLIAVNARYTSCAKQVSFFIKNRKRHLLKLQWILYACYAKMKEGSGRFVG